MEDLPKKIYACNPKKHADCKKTSCYENGGECRLTKNTAFMKTATEIIAEVQEEICNKYCKFPAQYEPTDEDMNSLMEEHCDNCPLNRL